MTHIRTRILLFAILSLGLAVRIIGINWDWGFMLHPDERMLVMVSERIRFFSQLDPQFFNYGTLPVYLHRAIVQLTASAALPVARLLSALVDMGTIAVIFFLARKIFQHSAPALLASACYALSVFPIQNAHFFVVDPFLTFFIFLTLFIGTTYLEKKEIRLRFVVLLSASSAAALATKFTGILLIPYIIAVLFIRFRFSRNLLITLPLFCALYLLFFFLFMPFGIIHFEQFVREISLQLRMNSNPYVFPYTLQYVGTMPYFYYLKNILLFGWGLGLSLLSFAGIYYIARRQLYKNTGILLLGLFCVGFFLLLGRSSVKFMRYLLPLYPLLAVCAGYGLWSLTKAGKKHAILAYIVGAVVIIQSILFFRMYFTMHTRIQASQWIQKNIPENSVLAVEHWDDPLPLRGYEKYQYTQLPLYDQPDDQSKWSNINNLLAKTDYIILSSDRLLLPITHLSNCSITPVCYPRASEYYKKLFNQSGVRLVRQFSFKPFFVNDAHIADESFSVYDHPNVYIFKVENTKKILQ